MNEGLRVSMGGYTWARVRNSAVAGVPQHEIQLLLGHADPRTTAGYIHHLLGLDGSPVYTVAAAIAPVTVGKDAR